MRIKPGVSITGVQPETAIGMIIADQVYRNQGNDGAVITSVTDSSHGYGSLHFVGYAFDLRVKGLKTGDKAKIEEELRERLGLEWDVINEKDHLHVEFQPKRNRA